MTLNLTIQKTAHTDFTPRITVIGVGGGGTNAVNNMIALNLPGVDFIVANTDAQQLLLSKAERRIQLGPHITQGNGAGGRPEVGRASAEEAADDLARHLDEAHMVFITAGMGGGTGTGAAPVIARMARERGILTVGVVTKPFAFEGKRRMKAAEEGIADLQNFVDTLIVIPNQNLFKVANERTGWKEAFQMADHVLYMGVRGVTDLMVVPGLVNLDYADIRSVMAEMGKAMMGTGEADGDERSLRAAEAAISNPLLEDTNMKGARGLLINITGGSDLTLFEVDQAANRIREEVDEDANIMFGTAIDEELNGRIRISVVATGIDTAAAAQIERPRLVAVGGGQAMAEAPAAAMAAQAAQQAAASAEVPSQPEIAAQTAQPQGGYPQHAQPHSGQPYSGQPYSGQPHSGQPNPVQQLHPAQMPQQQPQPPAPQHHGAQSDPTQHGAVRAPISAQAPLYPREQPARPAEPAKRPSLFNRMTQGLRAAAQAQAPRTAPPAEPQMPAQAPSHNAAPVYPPQQQPQQPQQAQPQHPQAHAQQAYPQHGQGQPMRAEQAPGGQSASGQAASGQMHFRGSHEEHRASVRQMQTEDIGLDIPAFLRRQHS